MNYTGPKVRLSRRLGIPLTPRAAKVMEKRSNPPGQHGGSPNFRKRESDYARQLLQKQRLRAQYSLTEQKLRNYVRRATRGKGVTGVVLLQMLETRLDAFVLRAGFAPTIYAARQVVTHGHFLVDGAAVNLPSYELRPNQIVSVRPKSRRMTLFADALAVARPPAYIALDPAAQQAYLRHPPARADVPVVCEEQLVIEFYSR